MERLYYQTPYVKRFQGTVVSCIEDKNGRYEVELDQTGFYPEGGGQPSDTGLLFGVPVLKVHEKQGRILHYLTAPLQPGSQVEGQIDWMRRYDNMQLHSGEHLVSGLIHKHYGYDNVGFHMGSEEVTIDFNGLLTKEQLMEIELKANQVIYDNLPVQVFYPTEEELHSLEYRSKKELTGQVRIVKIPGADVCACCGTHVEKTGEIGLIKFLSMIHYKGGVRISMLCGRRALEDYEMKQEQVVKVSNLLSVKPHLVADAVEKLKLENSEKEWKLNQLYQRMFHMEALRYEKQEKPLILFREDLAPIHLRQFCTVLAEEEKGNWVLVFSGDEEHGYQYALGSVSFDMRELSKKLNEKLNGRGGGSKVMAQGSFQAKKEEILSAGGKIG